MRIAIVSDIHDNLTAFQAVLADLRETSPDLVLDEGDLRAQAQVLERGAPYYNPTLSLKHNFQFDPRFAYYFPL